MLLVTRFPNVTYIPIHEINSSLAWINRALVLKKKKTKKKKQKKDIMLNFVKPFATK